MRNSVQDIKGSTRFGIDCTAKARARTRPAREPRPVRLPFESLEGFHMPVAVNLMVRSL